IHRRTAPTAQRRWQLQFAHAFSPRACCAAPCHPFGSAFVGFPQRRAMKAPRAIGERRSLQVLGIGEAEEALYRQLLAQPGASLRDLGAALQLGARKLQRLLESLELRGLATHSPEHPRRWHPAPPDLAIEALINQQQEDLQRARAA